MLKLIIVITRPFVEVPTNMTMITRTIMSQKLTESSTAVVILHKKLAEDEVNPTYNPKTVW